MADRALHNGRGGAALAWASVREYHPSDSGGSGLSTVQLVGTGQLTRRSRVACPSVQEGRQTAPSPKPLRGFGVRAQRAVSIAAVAKEVISTSEAPGGFAGYSQAIRANGVVFVSGQGPFDPATGDVVGETIEEQTRQCLRNLEAILEAAGSTMDNVVQATFILLDESDFAGMNEEWNRWFPTNPPARQGAKLPISPKGMRISIAAIAVSVS
jgi:2-iminobutanoate/2-iminopropanoate deaminase